MLPDDPAAGSLSRLGIADEPVVLARSSSDRGEVLLRRRWDAGDQVDELIVNGAFAMDSLETSSERRLALLAVPRGSLGGGC